MFDEKHSEKRIVHYWYQNEVRDILCLQNLNHLKMDEKKKYEPRKWMIQKS